MGSSESFQVAGAKFRSPRTRASATDIENQRELRRQIGGWVTWLMKSGVSENKARRIATAVTYGPLVSFVVWGLMATTQ